MHDFAINLHRLMARQGLTAGALAKRCGLHERTVKAVLAGRRRPHARTVHELAAGLGVEPDELYRTAAAAGVSAIDRQTNPQIDDVVRGRPELFYDWDDKDLADLYSRFGEGGPLTTEGVLQTAAEINRRRRLLQRVAVLLETADGELLTSIIDAMYDRLQVSGSAAIRPAAPPPRT